MRKFAMNDRVFVFESNIKVQVARTLEFDSPEWTTNTLC